MKVSSSHWKINLFGILAFHVFDLLVVMELYNSSENIFICIFYLN